MDLDLRLRGRDANRVVVTLLQRVQVHLRILLDSLHLLLVVGLSMVPVIPAHLCKPLKLLDLFAAYLYFVEGADELSLQELLAFAREAV